MCRHTKSLCTQDNANQSKQSCVYTTISRDFLCWDSVSHLLFNGRHKINLSTCALIFCVGTHELSWVHINFLVSTQCLIVTLEWLTQHEHFLCWNRISLSTRIFLCCTRIFLCWQCLLINFWWLTQDFDVNDNDNPLMSSAWYDGRLKWLTQVLLSSIEDNLYMLEAPVLALWLLVRNHLLSAKVL